MEPDPRDPTTDDQSILVAVCRQRLREAHAAMEPWKLSWETNPHSLQETPSADTYRASKIEPRASPRPPESCQLRNRAAANRAALRAPRSALERGARAGLPEDPQPGTAGQEGRAIHAQDPAPGPIQNSPPSPSYRVSGVSQRLVGPQFACSLALKKYADPHALSPSGYRAHCTPCT